MSGDAVLRAEKRRESTFSAVFLRLLGLSDMLIVIDINLEISGGYMCLRLYLYPQEKTKESGSCKTSKCIFSVSQRDLENRQAAIFNMLQKQLIEQLVKILKLRHESLQKSPFAQITLFNKWILCSTAFDLFTHTRHRHGLNRQLVFVSIPLCKIH